MTTYTLQQAEAGVIAPKDAVVEERKFQGVGLRYRYKATIKLVRATNEADNKEVWLYQTSIRYGHDWENPRFKGKGAGSEANWLLFESSSMTSITPPFESLEAIRSAGDLSLPSSGNAVDRLVKDFYN